MKNKFIPVCEPFLGGNEKKYILEAIDSGWISSSGKYIEMFENAFADYCGVKYGIAVCNGTAALHLALIALGIGPGDEVIVPDYTMIACAFAVCYTGAAPVFVDACRDTWNIDIDKIEEKITQKTKAIMVVHIYGHPCDMNPIITIANKYNLKIIEDSAEAHGALYKGKKTGSFGDISTFSFYANKIVTSGEGGIVLTDDNIFADNCRYYKNICFKLNGPRDFVHNDIGFNYRMSNIIAAIALAQVEKIDYYVNLRRNNNKRYQNNLKDIPYISFQPEKHWAKNVYWMNGIVVKEIDKQINRDSLMKELSKHGIETRYFFAGLNKQPCLIKYGCDCSGAYPVTDFLSKNGLYLPSSSNLKVREIDFICDIIQKYYKKYGY